MPDNHVKDTVDHVTQALDTAKTDGDQQRALEKLQDDIKKDTKGMTPDQQKEYMGQLTKALEDKNELPILSVVYAGQLGGDLNKNDINSEMRAAGRAQRDGDNTKQLDQAMLKYLADNYDKGANLVETRNEEWGKDSKISKGDIADKLAQFRGVRDEQHRKETNQGAAEKTAGALLDGGDQSLFNFIDRNSKDGRITKQELQNYLNDAKASGSDTGQFSKDKQQVVEKLLKDWDNRESGKWMRGGFAGDGNESDAITKQGLIKAAGKNTESEVTHKVKADVTIDAKPGEGYWQLAARNLGKDGKPHNDDEVRQEAQRIGNLNGNKPVHAGDHIKVGEEMRSDKKPEPPKEPEKKDQMEIKAGDSYWTIAHRIVGDKASTGEIFAKMKELQKKNDEKPLYYDPRHPSYVKI